MGNNPGNIPVSLVMLLHRNHQSDSSVFIFRSIMCRQRYLQSSSIILDISSCDTTNSKGRRRSVYRWQDHSSHDHRQGKHVCAYLHVCYECVGSAILFTPLLPLGNVVEYSFVAMKMRTDMSK